VQLLVALDESFALEVKSSSSRTRSVSLLRLSMMSWLTLV
jgi:hypothetical protein